MKRGNDLPSVSDARIQTHHQKKLEPLYGGLFEELRDAMRTEACYPCRGTGILNDEPHEKCAGSGNIQ